MTSVPRQQKSSSERCRAAGPPFKHRGSYLASALSSQINLGATSWRFHIFPSFHPSALLPHHSLIIPAIPPPSFPSLSLYPTVLLSSMHPFIHPSTQSSNHLSVPISSSIFPFICQFPTHPSFYPTIIHPSISIRPSTLPSLYPLIILSTHPSIFPPIHLAFPPKWMFIHHPYFHPPTSLSIYPSFHPAIYTMMLPSFCPSFHSSISPPTILLSFLHPTVFIHPCVSIHKYLDAYCISGSVLGTQR